MAIGARASLPLPATLPLPASLPLPAPLRLGEEGTGTGGGAGTSLVSSSGHQPPHPRTTWNRQSLEAPQASFLPTLSPLHPTERLLTPDSQRSRVTCPLRPQPCVVHQP